MKEHVRTVEPSVCATLSVALMIVTDAFNSSNRISSADKQLKPRAESSIVIASGAIARC